MRAFNKSTRAEIEKIRQMFRDGNSIFAIAKYFGRDRSTVYYWLGLLKNRLPKDTFRVKDLIEKKIKKPIIR